MRFLLPALLLCLLVSVLAMVAVTFLRSRGQERLLRTHLAEVKDLAWSHRDIDPELASALISRVETLQKRSTLSPDAFDELLDVAWTHRESSPSLSAIVVDEIRGFQRREIE